MKKVIFCIFLVSAISVDTTGQSGITDIDFFNTKDGKLKKCQWGNFNLLFSKGVLEQVGSNDSCFYYNELKKEIVIKPNGTNDYISFNIRNDTLFIFKNRGDSMLFFPNLISVENYNPSMRYSGQIIQVHYSDYRLLGFSVFYNSDYSVSAPIFTLNNKTIGWDIILSDKQKRNIRMYQDNSGNLSTVNFSHESGLIFTNKTSFPGIEMLYAKSKTKLYLYKVREVKTTNYKGIFAYSDLITYDKKGKMKSSRMEVKQYE